MNTVNTHEKAAEINVHVYVFEIFLSYRSVSMYMNLASRYFFYKHAYDEFSKPILELALKICFKRYSKFTTSSFKIFFSYLCIYNKILYFVTYCLEFNFRLM